MMASIAQLDLVDIDVGPNTYPQQHKLIQSNPHNPEHHKKVTHKFKQNPKTLPLVPYMIAEVGLSKIASVRFSIASSNLPKFHKTTSFTKCLTTLHK